MHNTYELREAVKACKCPAQAQVRPKSQQEGGNSVPLVEKLSTDDTEDSFGEEKSVFISRMTLDLQDTT